MWTQHQVPVAGGMFSSWESQDLQGWTIPAMEFQPALIQARPNTSGKPLGVPKPVEPGSLTPQMGVGATKNINPTARPRLIPFSVPTAGSRHKTPAEPPLLQGMGPVTGVKAPGNSTPQKTPARTTTTTPPARLLQAGAVSQLLLIPFGDLPPKICTEEAASTGYEPCSMPSSQRIPCRARTFPRGCAMP